MKKLITFTCCIVIAAGAIADQQTYWNLSAGWAQPGDSDVKFNGTTMSDVDYDAGWIIEGSIGNKLSDLPIAYELALSYQQNEATKQTNASNLSTDVNIWSLMANGMYFIETDSCYTPYGFVGIGFIDYDADRVGGDTVFAGQFGAGLYYSIDATTCMNLEYRYLISQDIEDDGGEIEFDSQTIQLGISYMY
jgi:opacity protein-like surface antigen